MRMIIISVLFLSLITLSGCIWQLGGDVKMGYENGAVVASGDAKAGKVETTTQTTTTNIQPIQQETKERPAGVR